MTGQHISNLKLRDFRSINREVTLQLDAPVVLIHGPNGSGKTSILSAIELALTGEISSLQKVDHQYRKQLLHYDALDGYINLDVASAGGDASNMSVVLSNEGVVTQGQLTDASAQFFTERCYLAQSTLSQLLTIYQQSGASMDSPLSKFVNELLGLDRLDALELGLHAADDLRNTKKIVPSYVALDKEIERLTRESAAISSKLSTARQVETDSNAQLKSIESELTELGFTADLQNSTPEGLTTVSERQLQSDALTLQGQISAIATNYRRAQQSDGSPSDLHAAANFDVSQEQLNDWLRGPGAEVLDLLQQASDLAIGEPSFGLATLEAEMERLATLLNAETRRLSDMIDQNDKAVLRRRVIEDEILAINTRQKNVLAQMENTSSDGADLSRALSATLPHIHNDMCPICNRDFSEISEQNLSEFVTARMVALSDAAERMVQLSKDLAENTRKLLDLQNELNSLNISIYASEVENGLQNRQGKITSLIIAHERLREEATRGQKLFLTSTKFRRLLDEWTTRSTSQQVAVDALQALDIPPYLNEPYTGTNLNEILDFRLSVIHNFVERLMNIIELKERASSLLATKAANTDLLKSLTEQLVASEQAITRLEEAKKSAEAKRKSFRLILSAVQSARSEVVSTVFNQRLNNVWRDLFVRLAPTETFVPSFFLPPMTSKRTMSPDLLTIHRSGRSGGAPGAMLSAGNLNTAALTLFLALHLSVQPKLPWLLLDDPVQSMDDVHISQFASLLRTLSKEQGRQVLVAVHERALFEYLSVELAPAFENDKLITIELGRSSGGETRYSCKPHFFKPSSVIQPVAA